MAFSIIKRLINSAKARTDWPGDEPIWNEEHNQLQRDISPIHVDQGDTIELRYDDPSGRKYNVLSAPFTEPETIDRVAIFRIENERGFREAVCGAFGRKA